MDQNIDNSADIYEEFYPKVLSYTRSKINCANDAEDMASEVMTKVFANLNMFDPAKASLSTWIYTIAKNSIISYYRKQHNNTLPIEENYDYSNEFAKFNYDILLDELYEGLSKLTDIQRDIVVLHYWHGLSHKEIAERVGLSYANTQKICSLAIKELRAYFKA